MITYKSVLTTCCLLIIVVTGHRLWQIYFSVTQIEELQRRNLIIEFFFNPVIVLILTIYM